MTFQEPWRPRPGRWSPAAWLRELVGGRGRRGRGRAEPIDAAARFDFMFAHMSRAGLRAPLVPEPQDAAATLSARVDRLARAGALDEGNGAVFDPVIDAWADQWANRLDAEHDARLSVLRQREEAARARALWLGRLAAGSQLELRETERRLDALQRWNGRDARALDTRRAAVFAADERLDDLSEAR